jgi:hypothetical protein
MEIFVSLATKILFPEVNVSENNINYEHYVSLFVNENNDFIRSIYKFMIIHHGILKTNTAQYFQSMNYVKMRKFDFLQRNLRNIFFTDEDREKLMQYFSKIQRHYFALMRFHNIWKYKRARITVSDDLYLNPIDADGKNIFVLVQNKKKYLFSLANLINMVNSSLSNTCHFFSSPVILKNPYSNILFNKADLYNLYFAIKKSSFIMPVLFHYYFLTNFNITKFRDMHEGVIREISINNHIHNSDYNTLYNSVINMLKEHKPRIYLDPEFPKEEVVNIMRPYLHLYYISMYSLDEHKKLTCFSELTRKLHKFYKHNPKFGRKIVKKELDSRFKYTTKIEFNKDCVNFNKPISVEEFMKNHEKCLRNNEYSSDEESEEEEQLNSGTESAFRFLFFQNIRADTRPIQTQVEESRDDDSSSMDIVPYDNGGYSQRYSVFDEDTIYREIIEDIISDDPIADEPGSGEPIVDEDANLHYPDMSSQSDTESDEIIINSDSDSEYDSNDESDK